MDEYMIKAQASEDFNKARSKEFFSRLLGFLFPKNKELLSFREIKSLVGAKGERYKGMQVVPIEKIVGSEGRYRDFNKTFLPKHNFLRGRWEKVDRAHLKDIVLPPIKLYQIGDYYFVRDGNHRVSVAKSQGVGAIDAEVIEVKSDISLDENVKIEDLKETVLKFECDEFYANEVFEKTIPREYLHFSATGRYQEIALHIQGHKYFINQDLEHEISLEGGRHLLVRNHLSPYHRDTGLSKYPSSVSREDQGRPLHLDCESLVLS
jgi:hypothetical protein